MSAKKTRSCPTCGADVSPPDENEAFPFCGRRCRALDLGSWLDGRYRIPDETPVPIHDESSFDD